MLLTCTNPSRPPHSYATWDHIFPRGQRGKGDEAIQMLACSACNNKRSDAPPTPEHIAYATRAHDEWVVAYRASLKGGKAKSVQLPGSLNKAQRRIVARVVKANAGAEAGATALIEAIAERRPFCVLRNKNRKRLKKAHARRERKLQARAAVQDEPVAGVGLHMTGRST